MLDMSPHLLEPLYVNTNINYDLDLSKFPGLDDPQHMYQPALLIAADWSNYVHDDHVTEEQLVEDLPLLDDIDECMISDMISTTEMDLGMYHTLLDDVKEDPDTSTAMEEVVGNSLESADVSLEDFRDLAHLIINDINKNINNYDSSHKYIAKELPMDISDGCNAVFNDITVTENVGQGIPNTTLSSVVDFAFDEDKPHPVITKSLKRKIISETDCSSGSKKSRTEHVASSEFDLSAYLQTTYNSSQCFLSCRES